MHLTSRLESLLSSRPSVRVPVSPGTIHVPMRCIRCDRRFVAVIAGNRAGCRPTCLCGRTRYVARRALPPSLQLV